MGRPRGGSMTKIETLSSPPYLGEALMWVTLPNSGFYQQNCKDREKQKKCGVCSFYRSSSSIIPDNTANVTSSTPFFNDTCTGSVSTGGRIADV